MLICVLASVSAVCMSKETERGGGGWGRGLACSKARNLDGRALNLLTGLYDSSMFNNAWLCSCLCICSCVHVKETERTGGGGERKNKEIIRPVSCETTALFNRVGYLSTITFKRKIREISLKEKPWFGWLAVSCLFVFVLFWFGLVCLFVVVFFCLFVFSFLLLLLFVFVPAKLCLHP